MNKRRKFLFFMTLVVVLQVGQSNGLRLTSMNTPIVADIREDMELDCQFDMGVEELYAVKWYKDDQEFFRYRPSLKPNTVSFAVPGVHIAPHGTNCSLDHCKVKLHNLSREHSGGAYRCEISSEAPAFRLASATHNITVAALPKENPRIEGLATSYAEGDILAAKCISDYSDPPPILTWHINGQWVRNETVGPTSTSEPNPTGLVSRSVTLHLLIDKKLMQNDVLEIQCESVLPGIPSSTKTTSYQLYVKAGGEPQIINNQKLHWIGHNASPSHRSFHFILISVGTLWSIQRIAR